jgi:16S rRNA (adenine1518-N6/adenine1519-N6)-dimethyltransferase
MNKRRRLGQHLLIDTNVLNVIIENANIRKDEVVYEIGTGNGILTAELCKRAGKVMSCEIDRDITIIKDLARYDNLMLLHGDGFKFDVNFDVFVSNLPYSRSRRAVEWLATKKFDRAIVMLQKEFASKILSSQGSNYRAISALAQHCFNMDAVMHVGKNSFNPRPKVDSVLLKIVPQHKVDINIVKALKLLFSYRGKRISNVIRKFKINDINIDKRVEQLTPNEAIELAGIIDQRQKQLLQSI